MKVDVAVAMYVHIDMFEGCWYEKQLLDYVLAT